MLFGVGVSPRAAAQAGQPPWASDRETGCTASLQDIEKIDVRRYSDKFFLTWTGACKSGKLDGYGTLTIWNDSILSGSSFISRMEMTPESGLRMNDGVVSVALEPSDLRIEVARDSVTLRAEVAIYTRRKVQDETRYRATIMAIARYLQAALPSLGLPNNSNVRACIKAEGDVEQPPQSPGGAFLECAARVELRRNPPGPVRVRNSVAEFDFQSAAAKFVRDSFYAVWTAELAARGETPESVQEEQRLQYLANLGYQFAKRNGVQVFPNQDELRTNPFNFQGKTVGILVSF